MEDCEVQIAAAAVTPQQEHEEGSVEGPAAVSVTGGNNGLEMPVAHPPAHPLTSELAIQEEALASLRSRWTAIARADAVIPTSTPTPRRRDTASHTSTPSTSLPPLVRTHPNSVSTSSTASSLPTVPDEESPTEAEAGPGSPNTTVALGGLWNAITADADETIQEGKRFWGQLLRTVGAATTGNVPEEGAAGRPMERVRSGGSTTGDEAKLEM